MWIQVFDVFNSFLALISWKLKKFTQKLKIFDNTENFAQSSLEERFGSESGRIEVFDIFHSFHALRSWKLKIFTQKLKISVNAQKFAQSSLEERFGS